MVVESWVRRLPVPAMFAQVPGHSLPFPSGYSPLLFKSKSRYFELNFVLGPVLFCRFHLHLRMSINLRMRMSWLVLALGALASCQLVLKACCNGDSNCQQYSQPEEMFGVSCCGSSPMNQFESICCENVTRSRRQGSTYIDRCCGNQTLAFDQTCCQGTVHNIPNGECCGNQAYSRSNLNALCCNGVLNLNVEKGSLCCGTIPFDGGIRESCCGNQVYQRDLYDGCCPTPATSPPTYQPYNTRTSLCCDIPIEKTGNMKCCHLREGNGTWTPKSFDYTTSCCAYPFTSITPKTNGVCVFSPGS